jgi:hypothetical protein
MTILGKFRATRINGLSENPISQPTLASQGIGIV